jgi:hypothetical protein
VKVFIFQHKHSQLKYFSFLPRGIRFGAFFTGDETKTKVFFSNKERKLVLLLKSTFDFEEEGGK